MSTPPDAERLARAQRTREALHRYGRAMADLAMRVEFELDALEIVTGAVLLVEAMPALFRGQGQLAVNRWETATAARHIAAEKAAAATHELLEALTPKEAPSHG